MGFLDDIKSKLPFNLNRDATSYGTEDTYDDGYYDEAQGGYDDGYQGDAYAAGYGYQEPSNGVLGQTRRGEAESIAVYTRSGELVGDADRHAATFNPPARSQESSYRPGAYDTPSTYAETLRSAPAPAAPDTNATRMSAVVGATPQLPAYVLRPESYDDVETVVRRVRTKQPVALVFVGVRTELAKRVLDFSYGFACGLGAAVREVGDRVFMVVPAGCEVKESDLAKLRQEGYLKK
ncbi:cell division protein SepF [Collinsella sp. zg1085]|uniref:cell division protein SepF n=1 Tax=Collinsella sp. zg1085 TaxID=2844380 RepID=UPI001C0D3254|nr:cell division protein SepF [Collinsella sp. zg1085]QWT18050.1 cell division protein SepF [Collinsella sp. zg1085]